MEKKNLKKIFNKGHKITWVDTNDSPRWKDAILQKKVIPY